MLYPLKRINSFKSYSDSKLGVVNLHDGQQEQ